MAPKASDAKAKAKRQKTIAIGGAVVLVLLLAVQVPRTMRMLNAQGPPASAEAPPPATTPAATVPGAPAGATTGATPAPATGSASAADSDPSVTPAAGQLVSFELFATKDPFEQQAGGAAGGGSSGGGSPGGSSGGGSPAGSSGGGAPAKGGGGAAAGAPGGSTSSGSGSGVVSGSTSSGGGSGPGQTTAPERPQASTTRIAVNGVESAVEAGASFPAAEPVFVLVSLGQGTAEIGIAGGSYADGGETVTLELGEPLTLVNTANGARYELKLVTVKGYPLPEGVEDVAPAGSSGAASTAPVAPAG